LSQLSSRLDHSDNEIERYFYNNQGLFCGVKTPSGQIRSQITHDIRDRPSRMTDINGPTVTQSFDELGRVSNQNVLNGGGFSTFGYSARGLENLNQQITPTFTRNTQLSYDLAARRITQTDALQQTTQVEFNTAGDVTRLIDQRQKTTRWNYDLEGRPTGKIDQLGNTVLSLTYDANGRVTSRWTPARGTTYFSYDAVGNLTYVNYPNSSDVSFSYDSLNRLIGMSDGAGSTSFTYTSSGQLASEDGPWNSDTVSYGYDLNRWRATMNLSQPSGKYSVALLITGEGYLGRFAAMGKQRFF
jgi:YD repeat-containing protein